MYEGETNYLKWWIKILCVWYWVFPKNIEIYVREAHQFTRCSPYFITIAIYFKIEGRTFRVALPSSIDFDSLEMIPKAFIRAYKRAVIRIEKERLNGKRPYKRREAP